MSTDPVTPSKIDVHVHLLPDFYSDAARANGHDRPDGFPVLPDWGVESALGEMDRMGIATAVLSISSPGVHFGDAGAACELARGVNEYTAGLSREHAGRFGAFGCLPLPDVDAAIEEARYVLDELGLAGVGILSNSLGLYLGDPRMDPLLEELNRRRAVVFLHPASPMNWEAIDLPYPRPVMEFLFESTRAVFNFIITGARSRYPDIELVVPHAGAALPVMADRIGGLVEMVPGMSPVSPSEIIEQLGGFWYDLAGFCTPRQLVALRGLVGADRLLYGSDRPFTPEAIATRLVGDLAVTSLLSAEERQAVYSGNAARLFAGTGLVAAG